MNSSPLNMVRQREPLPSSPMDSEPLAILHVKLSRTCISKEPKSTSLEYRHTVISLQLAIFGTSSNTNGCWCVAPCNCGEKSKCTERFSAWTTRNLPLREERLRDKPKKKKKKKILCWRGRDNPFITETNSRGPRAKIFTFIYLELLRSLVPEAGGFEAIFNGLLYC